MNLATVLNVRSVVELVPSAPYNFDATMHKPDPFPSADNEWRLGIRWQTMRWQGRPLGLKFENRGTVDRPRVSLLLWSEDPLDQGYLDGLLGEIHYRDDLDLNLGELNERYAGFRALAVHYPWENLFWRRKHEPVDWLEKLIRL